MCGLRPPTGLRPSPLRPQAPRPRHRLWATSFARSRSLIPTTSAPQRSLPRTYGPSTTGLLCSVSSLKGLRSTYSGHIRTWWTSCERPQCSPDDPSASSTSPPESAAEAPRLNQISAKSDCIDLGLLRSSTGVCRPSARSARTSTLLHGLRCAQRSGRRARVCICHSSRVLTCSTSSSSCPGVGQNSPLSFSFHRTAKAAVIENVQCVFEPVPDVQNVKLSVKSPAIYLFIAGTFRNKRGC